MEGERKRTKVMGILNVTPDSFYDAGKHMKDPVGHALRMIEEGADIIALSGESMRPFAMPVSLEEERRRVIPAISGLRKANPDIPIAVDTYKPEVAEEALRAGAEILNDHFGFKDEVMIHAVSDYGAAAIVTHMKGTPQMMQIEPKYGDLLGEIKGFFKERIWRMEDAGIRDITIDPGISLGKTAEHSLELVRKLGELKELGKPVAVSPSRKSPITEVLNLPVEERLEGTLALVAVSIMNGADVIRVHDVKENVRVARMVDVVVYGWD